MQWDIINEQITYFNSCDCCAKYAAVECWLVLFVQLGESVRHDLNWLKEDIVVLLLLSSLD